MKLICYIGLWICLGVAIHTSVPRLISCGGEDKCKVEMNLIQTQWSSTREKSWTQNRAKKKKKIESMVIKTNSLSAVWTGSYPTPYPKPTGTGKWNNWRCLFFFFFSEKEKQETTSSDCFCLSVLVFLLCCPQNRTEKGDIGRIIFLTQLTSEILLSAIHHQGWNIIPVF